MDHFSELTPDRFLPALEEALGTRLTALARPLNSYVNRVYEVQAPDFEAARRIAAKLYAGIRGEHDWGSRFEPEPRSEVLDRLAEMAPREMRRAWMTGFGNAKLDRRDHVLPQDLPDAGHRRGAIGFVQ